MVRDGVDASTSGLQTSAPSASLLAESCDDRELEGVPFGLDPWLLAIDDGMARVEILAVVETLRCKPGQQNPASG